MKRTSNTSPVPKPRVSDTRRLNQFLTLPAEPPMMLWGLLRDAEMELLKPVTRSLEPVQISSDSPEAVARDYLDFNTETVLELFMGSRTVLVRAGLEQEQAARRPRQRVCEVLSLMLKGREMLERSTPVALMFFTRQTPWQARDALLVEQKSRAPRQRLIAALTELTDETTSPLFR